jgi:type VI protein secretion system component VasA
MPYSGILAGLKTTGADMVKELVENVELCIELMVTNRDLPVTSVAGFRFTAGKKTA